MNSRLRSLTLLAMVVLFAALPVLANCPEVLNLDDPPCVPCPFVFAGYWFSVGDFSDGSSINQAGERFQNCDGVNRYDVLYEHVWCPLSSENPCIARDLHPGVPVSYP